MKKRKRIIKSRPTTERLLQIRANRFRRDMEKQMRDDFHGKIYATLVDS